jgi:hypothetical protein
VRSRHDWDVLKAALLSEAHANGTTIVTTREESIAEHCSADVMMNIRCLVYNEALKLFRKVRSSLACTYTGLSTEVSEFNNFFISILCR